ncbi:MAG TPA: glycosyltransferase family 4 protein [Thermoanaerobaculia bacterium]|nr:glycosyltransferase family 4 protein [Thermoanaerobaculia bacterium]
MHIAVVCRALGVPGAVASVALRQARELTRHARITLVSDACPEDIDWADCVRVPMPNLHALRRFRHVPDEVLFGRGVNIVLRSLHGVDFILAHSHSTAHIGARKLGIPFGFFVHGDIFERPKGTYDARLTAFYEWIAPKAYRSADIVFALAPYLADSVRQHGARRVEVVPNGVDLADLGCHPERSEGPPRAGREADVGRPSHPGPSLDARDDSGPLRLITVGRLAVEKGVEQLLAAVRMLEIDYELTIIGTGPLERELRAAASDLPHVHFRGTVPRHELGALYRAHDVFVTATRNEAFGLVVLEALACGLPLIGTDIDALRSVVRDGENGLLVTPADPRALASAIERFGRDASLREKLAASAHDSVLPEFSWPVIGDQIASILRRMRT